MSLQSIKKLWFSIFIVLVCFLCLLVPATEGAQKIYDDLFSTSFPNDKEGWVSGRWGCILHTSDGGKTWVRQQTGTELTLSSVFFIDTSRGWAVGEEGIIIHTKDGGKTWEKQKSPQPYFHMRVHFLTPDVGFIVSEWTHIFSTTDGGKNWQVRFKDQDFILKSISFADQNNGWAVGEYEFIYNTRDGGKTWQKQAGKFGLSETTGDVEGGNYIFDIVALDPQRAWGVGIDGYVTKTVDGGKSWQEVKTKAPKTQLFCVATDNTRRTILIGGNGTFLASVDGGATWKFPTFTPPVIYTWIYGVGRRGNSGFVAVGANGVIYINEGEDPFSWKQVEY
jgi:photosystem II stability/assembly factor-like uncharacterized protein